ncbi:MAG: SPOR domain-containing protein [Gammaproteobacteria bacterium]|nr:SPOR domain-containing protein [Gammaproteobacteria bacterium]
MPKDYVRRGSNRSDNRSARKSRSPYSRKSSKEFHWLSFFILIFLVGILILGILYTRGKIHFRLPRKISTSIVKVEQYKSGAVVETATPVKFDKNQRAETQKVKFDFYTTLPKMKVEVSNLAANASTTQNQENVKYYILQIASFKDLDKAKLFQNQMKQKGFDTKNLLIVQHGEQWYRIQMGPIKNFDQAKATQQQLHDKNVNSVLLTFKELLIN